MAYVVEKAGLHYAVIYEGTNPITGMKRRRWHRCTDRSAAAALAQRLGTQRARIRDAGSVMTLGDYLVGDWLPAREAAVAPTTHASYLAAVQNSRSAWLRSGGPQPLVPPQITDSVRQQC